MKATPKKPASSKPDLPWLDPTTTNTRVCSCGAPNWGTATTCRKGCT
ncbi:hypothetical protein ACIBQX_18970 [Nonomuraea sp. NPDC049714]